MNLNVSVTKLVLIVTAMTSASALAGHGESCPPPGKQVSHEMFDFIQDHCPQSSGGGGQHTHSHIFGNQCNTGISCDTGVLITTPVGTNSTFGFVCALTNNCRIHCPANYTLNPVNGQCEAHCETGAAWNATTKACEPVPSPDSCESQSANPIGFVEGKKYRKEWILAEGSDTPIQLYFYYNNNRNFERTQAGYIPNQAASTYLADTMSALTGAEFSQQYYSGGLPKDATVLDNQYYGFIDQYWRHSYDDVIVIRGSQIEYHPASGNPIVFDSSGVTHGYPNLKLISLEANEETYAGYKLLDRSSTVVKKFDDSGRLRKIEYGPDRHLNLAYSPNNRLESISNNFGASIQFDYEEYATDSVYDTSLSDRAYWSQITTSSGRSIFLQWNAFAQGRTAEFRLLSRIQEMQNNAPIRTRTFAYNDQNWPASLTDIYDIDHENANEAKLYAHFEYNEQGQAVVSELAGGAERVSIDYVNGSDRIVTNALNKQTTFRFADFYGAKRLESVTGEATVNCAESNTTYDYYPSGNVKTKTRNGVATYFEYNDRNLETLRVEAKDTAAERATITCWHPTHDKPERVIESNRVISYSYDAAGRTTAQTIESRSSSNEVCVH